jgi:cytidyltransferase-like protein
MYKVGYCSVCADILHVGHIRFIQECSKLCEQLIVGVMTDEAIKKYKKELPIIVEEQRIEIIQNIKGVHAVVKQHSFESHPAWSASGVDVYFDTAEHKRPWANIFIRRTEGISSTQIKERIIERLNNSKRSS